MKYILLSIIVLLGACTSGKELPKVHDADPYWDMVQDHLKPGELR